MREREQAPSSKERQPRRHSDGDTDSAASIVATTLRAGRAVPRAALPFLQRAAGNAAVVAALGEELDGSLVHSVISSGGEPLSPAVQGVMESHLGTDLSDVRVHTDGRAGESAQAINAQAYTAGNHIVFQRKHYAPGTESGLRMLAHELSHVVQQRSGPVDGSPIAGDVSVSDPSDRFEQAAERKAEAVVRSMGGVAGLQRLEDDERDH